MFANMDFFLKWEVAFGKKGVVGEDGTSGGISNIACCGLQHSHQLSTPPEGFSFRKRS